MLDAHREEALAAVRRAAGDTPDAEDCVQDALIRLVERGDLDPDRVGALLTRTAVHIAIDRERARQRRGQVAERLRAAAEREVGWPEQIAADRADVARVLHAVEALPRRERQVMRLRLSGLSVTETARLLGVSYKSIEGTYTRARARLRIILGGALAWLAAKLRRFSAPQSGEPLAAAVAVVAVLVVAPFWRHAIDASRGVGSGTRAAVLAATGRAALPLHAGGAAPGFRPRILVDAGAGSGGGSGADRGDGHGRQSPTILTTGPVPTVPDPRPGQQPLLSGAGVTISGGGSLDPVGGIEQCLAQGGPTVQENVGPGLTGQAGCDT